MYFVHDTAMSHCVFRAKKKGYRISDHKTFFDNINVVVDFCSCPNRLPCVCMTVPKRQNTTPIKEHFVPSTAFLSLSPGFTNCRRARYLDERLVKPLPFPQVDYTALHIYDISHITCPAQLQTAYKTNPLNSTGSYM